MMQVVASTQNTETSVSIINKGPSLGYFYSFSQFMQTAFFLQNLMGV